MKKKNFIITIDTEGDNLWGWKEGTEIGTDNSKYLPRFQDLCNEFHFKPTWLTNWEMLQNQEYVEFVKKERAAGRCEIGMHLHAWNTPPFYELPGNEKSGKPYLIEYPVEIMEAKVKSITDLFLRILGCVPVSHRAGRWAINDEYFRLLYKYGYRIDCSVTPLKSWAGSMGRTPDFEGPDYTHEKADVHYRHGILEVPVTVLPFKEGKTTWLRPRNRNLEDMLWLTEQIENSDKDYLMFMLHSSELMPGGSPTFQTEEQIEKLYKDLRVLFERIAQGYTGVTLEEYGMKVTDDESSS